jgi:6-phosphofructo-2-kinase/fructose-2,6-biphosphatase 4
MACNATDIPKLEFPRNEIIEVCTNFLHPSSVSSIKHLTNAKIIPSSYNNVAKRIHIPDLPDHVVPGSPEDLKMPVAPSGTVSPAPGLGTPQISLTGTPAGGSGSGTPIIGAQPLQLRKNHVDPSS